MKNNNSGSNRFRFINPFRNSYQKIKSDEERKNKSVKFGLLSILFSCICVGLCYPCVWVGVKGVVFAFTHNFGILTYIIGIGNLVIAALSIGAMLIPYYLWLQGILLVVMQLYLNRKWVSWLALIIWIASLVGIFLLSLESFLVVTGAGHVYE